MLNQKELEKLMKPFSYEVLSIKEYPSGHMRVMLFKVEPPKKKKLPEVDDGIKNAQD
jgi:hypothetical protein